MSITLIELFVVILLAGLAVNAVTGAALSLRTSARSRRDRRRLRAAAKLLEFERDVLQVRRDREVL